MLDCEIVIIGAGPGASVAAGYLSKQGRQVMVIEKAQFPRFTIGESLIPRVMDHLDEAELLDVVKERVYEEKLGARFIRDGKVCDFKFSQQYTEGWTWTWQVPRADFDETLIREIQRKGVEVLFGVGVTGIDFQQEQPIVSLDNDQQIKCKFVLDCSGNARVIPRMLNLSGPPVANNKSSMFVHVEDVNRPPGVEGTMITFVVLEKELWYWVIPFSNGTTSLGFVGAAEYFEEDYEHLEMELRKRIAAEPNFGDRFDDVPFTMDPYYVKGYSHGVKKLYGDKFAVCGNSAEFLDPVFSSGVSFAMESGILAAKLAHRALNGEQVDWETEYESYIRKGVDTFRIYVNAWYEGVLQKIFFADEENPAIKAQICSVLAGYVWDETNPFVKKADRSLRSIASLISD